MVKVTEKQYKYLKDLFKIQKNMFTFGNGTVDLDAGDNRDISNVFSGKKLRKVLGEYALLMHFDDGDSFENHFEIKEPKSHYWKTDSGFYLGKFAGEITSFESKSNCEMLTKSEVENSDFDINKVHVCDEEFK